MRDASVGWLRGTLALVAVLAGCAPWLRPRPLLQDEQPLIITFWCAPPLSMLDDRRVEEIAAAGFTTIGAPCEGGLDPVENQQLLATAARHGLRVWIADYRISPLTVDDAGWTERLDTAVASYRNHPALGGYVVADEPPAAQFTAVAAVVEALRRTDPEHLAYVNLLPDYVPPRDLGSESYDAYLEDFITTVHPPLLSVDYYPFGEKDKKDRSTFFANLSALRAAALRHGLPFMLVVLAMPHGPYRDPSEAELAWQVNHALAFGARGISYFAYWTPPGDADWSNRYGLVEQGRPTLHYFQVARINRTLRALGEALKPYRSIAVADSLGEIGVAFPIGPIDAIDGGPVTAGLFGDGAGSLAALLVNRDYRYGVDAQLRLRPEASLPEVFEPDDGSWRRLSSLDLLLAPGGARLLRWRS